MSTDPSDSEGLNIEEQAIAACRMIRSETIHPLSWIFPMTNRCASCVLITGGHPEIMAYNCPRVIELLSEQEDGENQADQTET